MGPMGERIDYPDYGNARAGQPGRPDRDHADLQRLTAPQSKLAIRAIAEWCVMPAGRRGSPTTSTPLENRSMLATGSSGATVSRGLSLTTMAAIVNFRCANTSSAVSVWLMGPRYPPTASNKGISSAA